MTNTLIPIILSSAIRFVGIALTCLAGLPYPDARAEVTRPAIRAVVHSDHAVPGLPDETRFSPDGVYHYWSLGGSDASFVSDISGSEPHRAIWQQNSTGLTHVIVQGGDPAPSLPVGTYFTNDFWYLTSNATGDVAFTGNTTNNSRGIWADRNGSLEVVAVTDMPIPGMPGRVFQTAELSSMNDAGDAAVSAWIKPLSAFEQARHGIWSEGSGNGLQLLAAQGLPAPTVPGALFGGLGHPLINKQGRTTFFGSLDDSSPIDRGSIWIGSDYTDIRPVVITNDAYNSIPDSFFSFIGSYPKIDSAGDVYFSANVYSPSTGTLSGIWRASDGGLEELVRQDTIRPYPANPAIRFTGIGNVVVSDNGSIAFPAGIEGPGVHYSDSNEGIWLRSPDGTVSLVAREGDVPLGWALDEKLQFLFGAEPSINSRGQVVFDAEFFRQGQNPYVGSAILATDTDGELHTIARTGDIVDVDNGPGIDLRTISGIGFYSSGTNNGGFTSTFNDRGEVFFQAGFTDGSVGFFMSSQVAVPEPSIAVMLSPVVIVVTRRRKLLSRS